MAIDPVSSRPSAPPPQATQRSDNDRDSKRAEEKRDDDKVEQKKRDDTTLDTEA